MKKQIKQKEGMKRFYRVVCVFLSFLLMALPLCTSVLAAPAYEIVPVRQSTGQTVGARSYLIGGVTYVPFRAFVGTVDGSSVRWDAASRTAEATTSGGAVIRASVDREYIMYGERCFYTAAPVRLIDGVLYVPIRPLAACFGLEVRWNGTDRSVTLRATGRIPRHDAGVYDADALYWLSRIISAEAKSEPFRGQIAVGNVVLNRVASPQFPSTIYGVIFDRKHGVQFSPTTNGTIYATPTADAVRAAKICLEGVTLSTGILYFFNPRIAQSHWISANRAYAFRIGGHEFYD